METDTAFEKLVDSIVKDFAETGVPQNPPIIAGLVAEVFCKGFSERNYQLYTQSIEGFIRERIAHFLAEQEINAARQGQN